MLLNGDCPESLKKEEGVAEPPRENGLDEAEAGDETTGQEVIVIQDTGFSVKILAPGIEPFSLQVRWRKGHRGLRLEAFLLDFALDQSASVVNMGIKSKFKVIASL